MEKFSMYVKCYVYTILLYDFAFSFSNDILTFVWLIGYMSSIIFICLDL
jgi:hypothetical protein